jgi:hypothetical protein
MHRFCPHTRCPIRQVNQAGAFGILLHVSQAQEKAMSDGSDNGVDYYPTDAPAGQTSWKPTPESAPSDDGSDGVTHCGGGILDLGGLIGGTGSPIDVDFGQGDSHTAPLLDVVLGGGDTASVSLLGSDILGGDSTGGCGLIGAVGSLADVDLGQGDGHTAAVLDVVLGGDDTASVSLLGSEILGGEGLLGSGDIIGTCGLLDGLLDGCSLLS